MPLARPLPTLVFRRIVHGVVDSTSERAFASLVEGVARHGDLHLALGQTSGRGRLGRAWWSEPGAGLYASAVLMPRAPYAPAALTMAGALAVLDTVRALGAMRARLKWPNDVVVGDEKLSGVLAETRGFDASRPVYVLGIGINVAHVQFPAELLAQRAVTSLRLLGCGASVQEVEELALSHLASRLEQIGEDPARIESDFLAGLALAGAIVRVVTGAGEDRGRLLGLSLGRGLRISAPHGEISIPLEWVQSLR